MTARTYIACDPGDHGALIALDPNGALLLALPLPMLYGSPDPAAARAAIEHLPKPWSVVIEKAIPVNRPVKGADGKSQMMPDSGYLIVKRSVKFWAGVLGEKNPYLVAPATWQAAMLTGIQGADTKAKSAKWCQVFLPALDLYPGRCVKPHDGLSDAACLAAYGRRLNR